MCSAHRYHLVSSVLIMFFFSAALVILLQVKVFLFHELNTVMIKKRLLMNKIHCNVGSIWV